MTVHGDHALALAAMTVLGCGSVRTATSEGRAEAEPRTWTVDELAEAPVLVIDPLVAVTDGHRLSDFDDDWEGDHALPAPSVALPVEVTLLGGSGPCPARVGAAMYVQVLGQPYASRDEEPREPTEEGMPADVASAPDDEDGELVSVHTALVAPLRAACGGWFAVPSDADARLLVAPAFEYESRPPHGTHRVELGEALEVIASRGPPLDEICCDVPSYTLRASGRTLVKLIGDGRILGVLVLDETRWLAVDRPEERVLVEERTGREWRVARPSRFGMDWEASPCL